MVLDWVRVHKTKFIMNKHKNLDFDLIRAKLTDICNNDKTLPIRISVYSYDNSDSHQLYGHIYTSVREIGMGLSELELINKRGKFMGKL